MKTHLQYESIHMNGVFFAYEEESPVLKNINIEAHRGEAIGLIGANGAGKSTLLKLLVGLNLKYEGTLEIAGHPLNKENLKHIREHIGYVFQDSDNQLFMTTVEEDVAFGPRNYGLSHEEVEARVSHALRVVNIENLRHRQIYKLSGGEKKLAAIATILSMEPDIILLDEPSVALDPGNRRRLINLLNEMEPTKIIASHDLDFILDTCERVIIIWEGNIVADGPAKELLQNQTLLEEHGLELPLRYQRFDMM